MAFPFHAFLMALSLALIGWTAFLAPLDLWPLGSVLVISTLGLVGRVLVHRMDDRVRGQRLGSWTWTALLVMGVTIELFKDVIAYVKREAQASLVLRLALLLHVAVAQVHLDQVRHDEANDQHALAGQRNLAAEGDGAEVIEQHEAYQPKLVPEP